MNKDYVQQYVKLEKEHWWFVVRQKIILQFLNSIAVRTPLKILNIGAAGGMSSIWLSSLGKVVSLENDLFFIENLQQQGMEVVNGSINNMPFGDNTFDLVCAFDVIEHVKDDAAALGEMIRVCKPGGSLCVTVPAFQILWSAHDVVNQHYRRYTRNQLKKLSAAFPIMEIEIRYFNFILFLPILAIRKFHNKIFKRNIADGRSDFGYLHSRLSNSFFKKIFSLEITLLKRVRFPFGVSLFAAWKKELK